MKRGQRIPPKLLAKAIADANECGVAEAAKRHGISERSIETYRAKMRLKNAAERANKPAMLGVFEDFLREAVEALRAKLDKASAYETAGAIKIVGDLRIGEVALEAGGMVKDGERSAGAPATSRTIDVPALPMAAEDGPSRDARH